MTLYFIKESADDHYYERGGESSREPTLIRCPDCGAVCADNTALATHVGSVHPLAAPRLLLSGKPVTGEYIVHRHIDMDAITIANASEILVSENGGRPQPWSAATLSSTLAEADWLILDVTLRNERLGGGAAAVERVRLRVEVADSSALVAVDERFRELLATDELDEHRLGQFADTTSMLPRAGRYASALHDYGVGLLVKDRAEGAGTALPFAAHRAKLQGTIHVLRHFSDRAVARAVTGFVRFALNDFAPTPQSFGVPPLDRCFSTLQEVLGVPSLDASPAVALDSGRCPTDRTTAFILDTWEADGAPGPLADRASAATTTAEDAVKCLALAICALPADDLRVGRLARRLGNDPVFGAWAGAIVENAARHD